MDGTGSDKKKILVVDDDELMLSSVEIILEADYDVTIANSGNMALEYIYKGLVPDLVLLDILMPEMNGFETYRKMRGADPMQEIPIIFLTSISEKSEVQQALALGAADYIMKPYSKGDLMGRINNAIVSYEFIRRNRRKSKTA